MRASIATMVASVMLVAMLAGPSYAGGKYHNDHMRKGKQHEEHVRQPLPPPPPPPPLVMEAPVQPPPPPPEDWYIRGKWAHVSPESNGGRGFSANPSTNTATGGSFLLPGSGVELGEDSGFALDLGYFVRPDWSLEFSIPWTSHDVNATGLIAGLGALANTDMNAMTLMMNRHWNRFDSDKKWKPYLGAGLGYATFDSTNATAALGTIPGNGATTVNIDDDWGFALQAGVDYSLSDDWFLNLNAKYVDVDTKATFNTATTVGATTVNVARTIDVDVNPWIFGAGIGTRF